MKHICLRLTISVLCVLLSAASAPMLARAEQAEATAQAAPPPLRILITELQTAGAAAGMEFIELHNAGAEAVDLSGWQLRSLNASAADGALPRVVATIDAAAVVPAGGYFTLHTESVPLPAEAPHQLYSAALSNMPKVVALYRPEVASCQLVPHGAVAWGGSTWGEGQPVAGVEDTLPKLLFRYFTDGAYADTQANAHDFGMVQADAATDGPAPDGVATPGAANTTPLPASGQDASTPLPAGASALAPLALPDCATEPTDEEATPVPAPATSQPQPPAAAPPAEIVSTAPADATTTTPTVRNVGLLAPQIAELLPNPAKPQTDAQDEFIELYNPNTAPFDLTGSSLQVGSGTKKKRYTFPAGTLLAAKAFRAFTIRDTKLSLSNKGSQVWLMDAAGNSMAESKPYTDAKDGQAWVFAASGWQWTTRPTPGAINSVQAPAASKRTSASSSSSQKTSTVQGSAAAATGDTAQADGSKPTNTPDESASFNPLHPGILAITGVIAVAYGIYEYRHNLANKFHQLRTYRAARAKDRHSLAGRGGAGADQ